MSSYSVYSFLFNNDAVSKRFKLSIICATKGHFFCRRLCANEVFPEEEVLGLFAMFCKLSCLLIMSSKFFLFIQSLRVNPENCEVNQFNMSSLAFAFVFGCSDVEICSLHHVCTNLVENLANLCIDSQPESK